MTPKFFFYSAYGLNIKSSIVLPGVLSKETYSDIFIHFDQFEPIPEDNLRECYVSENITAKITHNNIYIVWQKLIVCSIQNNNEIILNSSLGLKNNFFQIIVLGIAIPLLLHRRGRLILHANTVNMDGKGVAFIGPRGIGKSTTSLALEKKGYNLLSDDVTCIKTDHDHSPTILSGFPIIKLLPEVIDGVGDNSNSMQKIHPNFDKRFYSTTNNFFGTLVPLKSIYLIKENNNTIINEISLQCATIELVKSTLYATIFDKIELSKNLKQCTKLAKEVPVKLLEVKRSLNNLHTLVEVIEDDIFSI